MSFEISSVKLSSFYYIQAFWRQEFESIYIITSSQLKNIQPAVSFKTVFLIFFFQNSRKIAKRAKVPNNYTENQVFHRYFCRVLKIIEEHLFNVQLSKTLSEIFKKWIKKNHAKSQIFLRKNYWKTAFANSPAYMCIINQ